MASFIKVHDPDETRKRGNGAQVQARGSDVDLDPKTETKRGFYAYD